MVAVNSFRRIAESARGIPGRMGLHEHKVEIIVMSTESGTLGKRYERERVAVKVRGQNPRVNFPSQRDIAQGIASVGSITIGPLTPQFLDARGVVSGGTPRELIERELLTKSDLLFVVVTGPQHPTGAKYRITNTNAEKAIHFNLVCSEVTGSA